MQKHTKIYLKYFNYGEQDFIPSELSGLQAQDIHHIEFRSHKKNDNIENLIALTREEHNKAHRIGGYLSPEYLQEKHNQFLENYERRKKAQKI